MSTRKKNGSMKIISTIIAIAIVAGVLLFGSNDVKYMVFDTLGIDGVEQFAEEPESKQDSAIIDNGKSDFTYEELQQTEGFIEFGELDHLGRATAANATITKDMYKTGTSANQSIKPTGWISGKKPHGHARGHLIGNQLGGSGDDERNLATIYQNPVNTPNMTKYENEVKNAIVEGDVVRYRVTPVFDGDELFAREIRMEGKSLTDWGTVDFDVTIPNEKDEDDEE